jgi:hypothetical protein
MQASLRVFLGGQRTRLTAYCRTEVFGGRHNCITGHETAAPGRAAHIEYSMLAVNTVPTDPCNHFYGHDISSIPRSPSTNDK